MEAEKNAFIIDMNVERSNPLIYRQVAIPKDMSLQRLCAVACIAFGREPVMAEVSMQDKDSENEVTIQDDVLLRDILHENDELEIQLTPSTGSSKRGYGITIFARVSGEISLKEGIAKNPSEGKAYTALLPQIITAAGYNIPQGEQTIQGVNIVVSAVHKGSTVQSESGEYYSGKNLTFSFRRTASSIRKLIAPETVTDELNMKLGQPLNVLLGKRKAVDLKGMAINHYSLSQYGNPKKTDVISFIHRQCSSGFLKDLFNTISISEFMNFRKLVTDRDPVMNEAELIKLMPALYDRGLVTADPKIGVRVANELLDYYYDWFDSEEEEQFIRNNYLKTAAIVSGHLYGVFDRKEYDRILRVIAPFEPDESEVSEYLSAPGLYRITDLRYMKHGDSQIWFDGYRFDTVQIFGLYDMRPHGDGMTFVPDKDEILRIAASGIRLNDRDETDLYNIIRDFGYGFYSYYGYESLSDQIWIKYEKILDAYRLEGNEENAVDAATDLLERLRWVSSAEAVKDRIRAIFHKKKLSQRNK